MLLSRHQRLVAGGCRGHGAESLDRMLNPVRGCDWTQLDIEAAKSTQPENRMLHRISLHADALRDLSDPVRNLLSSKEPGITVTALHGTLAPAHSALSPSSFGISNLSLRTNSV